MRRRDERGFSLVELVLALGLMAGVLISIAGLFSLGGRQIKSGRASSAALASGKLIVEEMNGWAFRQTYELLGFDGTQNTYTLDTRTNTNEFAVKWGDSVRRALGPSAYVTVVVSSLAKTGTPPALNDNATRSIRVVVNVRWNELARPRSATVATVRM